MVNRITFWNLTTLILILLVSVFGMYFINYPMRFDLFETIKDLEWKKLLLLFLGMIVLSLIFAMFPFKNLSFGNKFQNILLFLSVLILLYAVYYTTATFLKNEAELQKIEKAYIEQAQKDIKNDKVTFKYAGGLTLPEFDEKTYKKIDSIRENYGIAYNNTGCIVDFKEIKAQEKYENIVKQYLEKRNGKNWKEKMNTEIQKVKRDYR